MPLSPEEQAIRRVAARHMTALSEGGSFVAEVERALDILKDAIDVATHRTSDNPETGAALTDWNSDAAHAVLAIRAFSGKIAPHLRRIK